ncbi:MAG TPA: hypothetical protein PLM70_04270 [Bacteroidales bacterium]|nr:hypothetical protein [Bacteroidales bacterium]
MNKKSFILFTLIFFSIFQLSAQWRCKSEIGSYMKPIFKENNHFTWAAELLISGAVIDHYVATNDFAILALNFQNQKHKLYLEGGVKFYNIYDFKNNLNPYHLRPGFKELFYQYSSKNFGKIKIGMHSMRSNDDYLLNERAIGITYKLPLKVGTLSLNGGSVQKDFSINGTFCTTGYLYDVIPDKSRSLVGNGFGQTNFVLLSYDFKPEWKKKSTSEFEEVSEFQSEESTKWTPKVANLGVVAYSEFGTWIPKPVSLAGIYSSIDLGASFYLFPEILYQIYQDSVTLKAQQGVVYSVKLVKRFNWKNEHQTQFNIHYIGFSGFTDGVVAMNSFSNIFGGTILRLDVPELPFVKTGLRHIMKGKKEDSFINNMEVKAYGTMQLTQQKMWELDAELGKTFHFKSKFEFGFLVNLQYAYMYAPFDGITNPYRNAHLFRIETRLTF